MKLHKKSEEGVNIGSSNWRKTIKKGGCVTPGQNDAAVVSAKEAVKGEGKASYAYVRLQKDDVISRGEKETRMKSRSEQGKVEMHRGS